MGLSVSEISAGVAQAAGWQPAVAGPDGACRYFLEDGLDLEIRCPDAATCVMSAVLASLPDDSWEADAMVERICALSAASFRARSSVVSLDGASVVLHSSQRPAGVSEAVQQARDFLNDQAWWKSSLSGEPAAAQPTMQPFAGGWFPSEFRL